MSSDTRISELDIINAIPDVQRMKSRTLHLLEVVPGQRIVELGCGTGDDARELAELVGPEGKVVAVDSDEAVVAEARRRDAASRLPVAFGVGDVQSLSFCDSSFHGCRAERVLQHLQRPADALGEMRRVLRPGGRIVLVDTDWGTSAVSGADRCLTRAISDAWSDLHANGWADRQLPGFLLGAGFSDVKVTAGVVISVAKDVAGSAPFRHMAASAVAAGSLSRAEVAEWLAQLQTAANAGQFLWATTLFAASGRR